MKTIAVSESTYALFRTLVTPLMSEDAVLLRLLDLAGVSTSQGHSSETGSSNGAPSTGEQEPVRPKAARARRNESLPRTRYMRAILVELANLGGSQRAGTVQHHVYLRLESEFSEIDLAPLPKNSKELRWRNHARFAREELVKRGLLDPDAGWGIWALTDMGHQVAAELQQDFDVQLSQM